MKQTDDRISCFNLKFKKNLSHTIVGLKNVARRLQSTYQTLVGIAKQNIAQPINSCDDARTD
jgi:hypothetical protein